MHADLPEDQLVAYRSAVADPGDFDEFWSQTLTEARSRSLDTSIQPVTCSLQTLEVYDLRFTGADGDRVAAWLRLPKQRDGNLPMVVEFDGYGKGRGRPEQNLLWASAGYAHLELDTRGQSWSGWTSDTADPAPSAPHMPGMLTKGIRDRDTYYYRRVFIDAVRAFDTLPELPGVDPSRAYALGTSQGGGIALAATGLSDRVCGLIARVPFLCDIPRAIRITDAHPYRELIDYLRIYRDQDSAALETLAYFDGVNFARRARVPALFSVGLMDPVCPPSTVYSAHAAYAGPKTLDVWRYSGHEGGGIDDDLSALRTLGSWAHSPQVLTQILS